MDTLNAIPRRICDKAEKLQQLLFEMEKEVKITKAYLQRLLDNSLNVVNILENLASPQTFLMEFGRVNRILSRYYNLVVDLNCNLEVVSLEGELEFQKLESLNSAELRKSQSPDFEGFQFSSKDLIQKYRLKNIKVENEETDPEKELVASARVLPDCQSIAPKTINISPDTNDNKLHQNLDVAEQFKQKVRAAVSNMKDESPALPMKELNSEVKADFSDKNIHGTGEKIEKNVPGIGTSNIDINLISQESQKIKFFQHPDKWMEAPPFVPKFSSSVIRNRGPSVSPGMSMSRNIPLSTRPGNSMSHNLLPPTNADNSMSQNIMPSVSTCSTMSNNLLPPTNTDNSMSQNTMPSGSFMNQNLLSSVDTDVSINQNLMPSINTGISASQDAPQPAKFTSFKIPSSSTSVSKMNVFKTPKIPPSPDISISSTSAPPPSAISGNSTSQNILTSTNFSSSSLDISPSTQSALSSSVSPHCFSFDHMPTSTPKELQSSSSKSASQLKPFTQTRLQPRIENEQEKSVADQLNSKISNLRLEEISRLKPMNFERVPGRVYQVVFDNMVNPGEFYVQVLCSELSRMREMTKEIELHFRGEVRSQRYHASTLKCSERKVLASKELGSFAMSNSEDETSWTRIKIIDWRFDANDDKVRVFYVDYGDSKKLSLANIQPMDDKFTKYPIFAQRCHLSGVYPLDSKPFEPMPTWPATSSDMLDVILGSATTEFNYKITVCESDGCYPLDSLPVLFYPSDDDETVNDKMVKFGSAIHLENPPRPVVHRSVRSTPRPQKSSSLVSSSKFSSSGRLLDPRGLPYRFMEPPGEDQLVPISIICLLRANRFFCVRTDKDDDDLKKISDLLNNSQDMIPIAEVPVVNQLVLGKYSEDNKWYRAKVMKSDPVTNQYRLIYLDYGNMESVGIDQMRQMERKFLEYPFQIIDCHINGIMQSEDVSFNKTLDYLYSRVESGELSIKMRSVVSLNPLVLSVDLFDKDGIDIARELVVKNYAKRAE